jgi:kynurenine formamidase
MTTPSQQWMPNGRAWRARVAGIVSLCLALTLGAAAPLAQEDERAQAASRDAAPTWYPSRYGAGDTLGALNLLSPEKVVAAARLVRTGKTYALGVETGRDTPAFGTRTFQLFAVASGNGSGATLGANKAVYNDDWMLTWLGIGSQIDGLGHLGIDHRYYNGLPVADFWRPDGLAKLGLHELPPIVTRGVLLDVAAHQGVARLAAGTAISRKMLQAAATAQKVELREGDVVLVHTGWQSLASESPADFLASEPGIDVEAAEYLASLGIVAVGADTWGVEVFPNPDPAQIFPVHQTLLAKHGVYILENMSTAALAADDAYEFLFALGVPRFVGAVQMVVNPVAIR